MKRKSDIKNTNRKIVKRNTKCEIGKKIQIEKLSKEIQNVKLGKRFNEKIVKENMKSHNRKSIVNKIIEKNDMDVQKIGIGLRIVEQIVRIGSALSGLLPSIRHILVGRLIIPV